MYSTRKAAKPPEVACSSHGAAADAEAAGVAEAAEVAEDVAAAADAHTGAEPAVCRGALAASAEPHYLRTRGQTRGVLAGLDKVDPANPCVRGAP